ncbi:MAG: TfoX/Sxy family protein [Pseudomonadota bacterium]
MPYDPAILDMLRDACADWPTTERKMFGSHCLMLDGHMLVGAWHEGWLARVGPDGMAAALELGTEPFAPAGRPMNGIVLADAEALENPDQRDDLIALALRFVSSLPPK